MKSLFFLMLLLTARSSVAALPSPAARADTLPDRKLQQHKPTSRLAPPPMIMPGTRLDTNFNAFAPQSPAVGKAAPAWLRAKTVGSPVYIVDGKSATATQLRTLRRSSVASVNVLDGGRAATLYGKNASKGVIIITTKKGVAP